jgi:hypothetical protein
VDTLKILCSVKMLAFVIFVSNDIMI